MRKSDWNDFLDANEAHTLTLTLDQRNLLAEAGQHIDWLESRKRFSEEQAAELLAALEQLVEEMRPTRPDWHLDISTEGQRMARAAIDKARRGRT